MKSKFQQQAEMDESEDNKSGGSSSQVAFSDVYSMASKVSHRHMMQ